MTADTVITMVCTNPTCEACGYEIEIPARTHHGRTWAEDALEEYCSDCGEEMENVEL